MMSAVAGREAVLHLAALIAIPYSYSAPDLYVQTNVQGTLNLLNAARDAGVAPFVHTSTSEVYGTARFVPMTEAHPLQGQSPYSATKIGADQLVNSSSTLVRPAGHHPARSTPTGRGSRPGPSSRRSSVRSPPARSRSNSAPSTRPATSPSSATPRAGSRRPAQRCRRRPDHQPRRRLRGLDRRHLRRHRRGDGQRRGGHRGSAPDPPGELRGRAAVLRQQQGQELLGWSPQLQGLDGFRTGLAETAEWFQDPANLARYRTDAYTV